jgi:hypothetical protein
LKLSRVSRSGVEGHKVGFIYDLRLRFAVYERLGVFGNLSVPFEVQSVTTRANQTRFLVRFMVPYRLLDLYRGLFLKIVRVYGVD